MPSTPSSPGTSTRSTAASNTTRSGVTTSNRIFSGISLSPRCYNLHVAPTLDRLVYAANQVERLLGQIVVLAFDQLFESPHRFLQRHEFARKPGKLLRNGERLRQEPLNFPGSRPPTLVLLRQLVNPQDGNDVLQILVALQNAFDLQRRVVVFRSNNPRIQDP